jgi:hypothetical protein
MGVDGQRHGPATLHPENDPVPILKEAGWAPRPVWTGAENPAPPTGIRSPDRPACSELPHQLRYPGQRFRGVNYLCTLITEEEHLSTVPGISIIKKNNFFGRLLLMEWQIVTDVSNEA